MEMSPNRSRTTELTNNACGPSGRTVCEEFQLPSLYVSAIVTIIFNTLLAVTAVLGNGLIFAAYYQNQTLRKPVNTILLSLAATDFLTGAVSQPLYIYENFITITNCTDGLCTVVHLRRYCMVFLTGATLISLSVTTLDRYIAVCRPYKYLELVTNSRVQKVLVSFWLVWIGTTVAAFITFNVAKIVAVVAASIMIFIIFSYFKIFRQIRRLEANSVATNNDQEEIRKARERKSAKTVAIVLGSLVLCFVPLIFCGIVFVSLRGHQLILREHLQRIAFTALFSNSSINFYVYYKRNEEMRAAMLKVISKITLRCSNGVTLDHPQVPSLEPWAKQST